MKRTLFSVLLVSVTTPLFSLLLWSQTANNSKTDKKLRVSVVVSDAKGIPLAALRSDDFTVEIAGKTASEGLKVEAGSGSAAGRGLVVVVLDTIHTRWRDEKDVRAGALKYLSGLASRNEPVTLFVLDHDGRLNPVHDYQSGSATLAAALEAADAELHNRKRVTAASSAVDAETRRLVDFGRGAGMFAAAHETERGYPGYVLAGMETVAQYASTVPGRKSLVWVSSMIPFEVDETQSRVASLARNEEFARERLCALGRRTQEVTTLVEGIDRSIAAGGDRVIPGRGQD